MSSTRSLIRLAGGSLVAGGVLAALLNAILTPMLPIGVGSIAIYTSTAYGIRMPLAALVAVLVTIGCVGLYLAQAERMRFGALAFLLVGVGGMMLFWVEAVQATLIRDFAFGDPEALLRLEDADALIRWDVGVPIAAGFFLIGWLAVAILTLRLGVLERRGPATLLAGMLLIPILGALVPGVWGAVAGNVVLGSGWALIGFDLRRSAIEA